MKRTRLLIMALAFLTIFSSSDLWAKQIASTIHAYGIYSGIIRRTQTGFGNYYRHGFGGGVEYMIRDGEPKSWFMKHTRLGVSVTDMWLYRFRTPIPEGNNLLLFALSGYLSFIDMDKKIVPYLGVNVGGGLLGKKADFDFTGCVGLDYTFVNNISLIARGGGGINLGKGPPEDRISRAYGFYPRFYGTLGVGYTF